MKDICSILSYGPGACEWNIDGLKKKLLKAEMICTKCSKALKVYKSENTVDKWCRQCDRRKEKEMCSETKHIGITLGSCKVQCLCWKGVQAGETYRMWLDGLQTCLEVMIDHVEW
jgi:hypothetical protein